MNEAKRQLLEKIGDTSARTARVKANVKMATMQRQKKKTVWPYYLTIGAFAAALVLFFIMGPFTNDEIRQQADQGNDYMESSFKGELRQFFMEDGSVAFFEGEGYAHVDYMLETDYLTEDFIRTIETSAAAIFETVYYVDDDAIYIVQQEEVSANGVKEWSKEELEILKSNKKSVYLVWPIESEMTIGDYEVYLTNVTLKTPLQTFENVVVLQSEIEGATFRDFYVKGFGKIRSEMLEGENVTVYRELVSIGEPTPNFELGEGLQTDDTTAPEQESTETTQQPAVQMPTNVTLTSDLTGEQMTFPVSEIIPIRDSLQYSDSYEDEVARMSYTELYLPVENANYYLLKVNCNEQKFCDVYLISKVKDYRAVPVGKGIVDDYVEFSPNMQRALIRLSVTESEWVVRNQLAVIDLHAMQRNYVQTKTEYFSAATWPIEKYGWKDERTISIKAAEVFNSSSTAIEGWKVNSGTLMDIEIVIPYSYE